MAERVGPRAFGRFLAVEEERRLLPREIVAAPVGNGRTLDEGRVAAVIGENVGGGELEAEARARVDELAGRMEAGSKRITTIAVDERLATSVSPKALGTRKLVAVGEPRATTP